MGWNPLSWFGSSDKQQTQPGQALTRAERQRCWDSRDAYFACLDQAGVLEPGKEGGKCATQEATYNKDCIKSWVIHFNQRRVLDDQLKERKAIVESQGKGAIVRSL